MSVDEYRTVPVALIRPLDLYKYKHVLFTLALSTNLVSHVELAQKTKARSSFSTRSKV